MCILILALQKAATNSHMEKKCNKWAIVSTYKVNIGDTADLVPDYLNKVSIEIKSGTIFWFPSAYNSFIYIILSPRVLKKGIYLNIKKLLKNVNDHLSLQ